MDRQVLKSKQVGELREIAETLQLTGYKSLKKADLIDLIATGGAPDAGEDDEQPSHTRPSQARPGGNADDQRDADGMTSADRIRARRRGGEQDRQTDGGTARDRDADGGSARDRDTNGGSAQDTAATGRVHDDTDGEEHSGDQPRERQRSRNRKRGRGGQDINFDELEVRQGVLDLLPEGYGFLRTTGYLSGDRDVYVSQAFVRRNALRRGDVLAGPVRFNKGNDKFPALARIDSIEGVDVDTEARPEPRANFNDLTPVFPTERLSLETGATTPAAMRLLDVLAPIGKGQRGLVVSPPRAGKTTLLKQLAQAIEANNSEVHLMVLLVDHRPEEVTDLERSIEGEVISSTFDRPAEDHTQVAELTIERAKRIVEHGRDVVVLLDSITRLTRAYNLAAPSQGRTLASGLDVSAVHPPKRLFAAARNVEEGGSLTLIGTLNIGTGSALDAAVHEEFEGTTNVEIRLDGSLEARRLFPAIDVLATGTRRHDLLVDEAELEVRTNLRRALAELDGDAALEKLLALVEANDSTAGVLKAFDKSGLG